MSSEKDASDGAAGSDPRALRALAHPVRLDLLYLLEREGPLTASRAAELLGLTPKVCSYHLGTLGKYGVIEEAHGGRGRARPWRLRETALDYTHDPDEEPATTHAVDAFATTMLARDARVVEEFIRRRHRLPRRWRNVSAMSSTPLRLTPGELRELRADLLAVLHRYNERGGAPRPGAHPVHTAVYAVPTELGALTAREED